MCALTFCNSPKRYLTVNNYWHEVKEDICMVDNDRLQLFSILRNLKIFLSFQTFYLHFSINTTKFKNVPHYSLQQFYELLPNVKIIIMCTICVKFVLKPTLFLLIKKPTKNFGSGHGSSQKKICSGSTTLADVSMTSLCTCSVLYLLLRR